MKQIAVLEWGPLSMCQRSPRERLKIRTRFMPGGPFLPAFPYEDSRSPGTVYQCSVRYAISAYTKLDSAIRNLRLAFGYGFPEAVGYINMKARRHRCCAEHMQFLQRIEAWAIMKSIDAVVWIDYESLANKLKMGEPPSAFEDMQKIVRDTFDDAKNWRPPIIPEKERRMRLKQQYVTQMTSWIADSFVVPPSMPWVKQEVFRLQQRQRLDFLHQTPQPEGSRICITAKNTTSVQASASVLKAEYTGQRHSGEAENKSVLRTCIPMAHVSTMRREKGKSGLFPRVGGPPYQGSVHLAKTRLLRSNSDDLYKPNRWSVTARHRNTANNSRKGLECAPAPCNAPADADEDETQGGLRNDSPATTVPENTAYEAPDVSARLVGDVRVEQASKAAVYEAHSDGPVRENIGDDLTLIDNKSRNRSIRFFSEPARAVINLIKDRNRRRSDGLDTETLKEQIQPEVIPPFNCIYSRSMTPGPGRYKCPDMWTSRSAKNTTSLTSRPPTIFCEIQRKAAELPAGANYEPQKPERHTAAAIFPRAPRCTEDENKADRSLPFISSEHTLHVAKEPDLPGPGAYDVSSAPHSTSPRFSIGKAQRF